MSSKFTAGWQQVFVAFLIQCVSTGTIVYSFSVISLVFDTQWQPSRTLLTASMSAMVLVSGLMSPWIGVRLDKGSIRQLMLIGAVLLASGFALLSVASSMIMVIAIYAIFMSMGSILLGPLTASALLARWFEKRRALAMGIAAMGTSLGGFVFPPLVQSLIDQLGNQMSFVGLGAIVLVATVPFIFWLTIDRPSDRGLHADGEDAPPLVNPNSPSFDSSAAVFRSTNFWLIGISLGILFGTYSGLMANMGTVTVDFGHDSGITAGLLMQIAVCGFIGKLLFGSVADKVDLRFALGAAILSLTGGFLLLSQGADARFLSLGAILAGLAAGGMLPVWGALLAKCFGTANYGRVMGLMSPVIMPFNIVGPPALGAVADLSGSYVNGLLLYAGLLTAVISLLFFIRYQAEAATAPAS